MPFFLTWKDTLVLGGGLPLGYWLSISADQPAVYVKLFTQFFLAEGVESDQSLLVIGRGAKNLLEELPHLPIARKKLINPKKSSKSPGNIKTKNGRNKLLRGDLVIIGTFQQSEK